MEPVNAEQSAEALIDAAMRDDSSPEAARNRRVAANRAAANALRNTLRSWFTFYNGYDPVFGWWNAEAYQRSGSSMSRNQPAGR